MSVTERQLNERLYANAVEIYGALNIPPAALLLRRGVSEKPFDVYDPLRRRWVALTPEEWVRQHFVAYMVESLGFSALRMANEVTLKFNGMTRRADTVVYDRFMHPQVVVEYKAPSIPLTESVLNQAMRYNLVFRAPAVIITNGLDVFTVEHGVLRRGLIKADAFNI